MVDNSELKSELKKIETMLGQGSELELLRSQVKAMQEAKELMIGELVGLRKELEIEKSKNLELNKAMMELRKAANDEKRRLEQENDRLAKEALAQVNSGGEHEQAVQTYKAEVARLEQRNKELSQKVEQMAFEHNKKVLELDEKCEDLKQRLHHSESLVERLESDQEQFDKNSKSELQEVELKKQEQIEKMRVEFEGKVLKYEQQLDASAESEAKIENERRSLEHIVNILRDENCSKETRLEQMSKELEQLKEQLQSQHAKELEQLRGKLDDKIKVLEVDVMTKQQRLELFEQEKHSLEKQVELINRELKKVEQGLELKVMEYNKQEATLRDLKSKFDDMNATYNAKCTNYDQKIEILKQKCAKLEQEVDYEKKNSSSFVTKNQDLERKCSELQTQATSTLELLELRQKEFDSGKQEVQELRRKYDDTLAALLDIGRENQQLQMEQAKLLGRKWADDSQCSECTNCAKAFTLTVRKVS